MFLWKSPVWPPAAGLAFKGLETIYALSTFTAHKSKGKCANNKKERKIM